MNEIERAVKWLEDTLSEGKCKPNCVQCCAYETALSALREKMERSKGCEYCTDLSRYKGFGYAEFFHQTAADEAYEIGIDVKFCPNCGRNLDGGGEG